MAVSKKLKGLYMGFFDGLETACANLISNFIELRYLRKFGGEYSGFIKEKCKRILV